MTLKKGDVFTIVPTPAANVELSVHRDGTPIEFVALANAAGNSTIPLEMTPAAAARHTRELKKWRNEPQWENSAKRTPWLYNPIR